MNLYKALMCLGIAAPAFAQYGGPAILSRGEAPAAMATPEIDFRPFLTVSGTYDTGLAAVSVNSQGQLANASSFGMQFGWGVSGTHSWKHTKIGLDYKGSINDYFTKTYYDGLNQSLGLGITHEFSRRLVMSLSESTGIFSQNYTTLGLPQTVPFDSSQSNIPVSDFFDNRTIFSSTSADLIYRMNSRLSYDIGGSYFTDIRRSSALYGSNGLSAHGDFQYRLTRRTTMGVQYGYSHYTFPGITGSTDMHTLSGTFSTRLSKMWEFSGSAGAIRVESNFIESVPLNPVVAELLGVSSGLAVLYNKQYVPGFSGRLSATFRKGVFYLTGGRSITPGNGLFLTTEMTSAALGYSYTGLRHWSLTAQALYDHGTSLGNILGIYGDASGGLTVSRDIIKSVHFLAGADARRYLSPSFTLYNRTVYDAHIGLGWTPGNVPLRLW